MRPALWNAAYHKWQFWDGRADDLEAQAAGPITNEHEMGEKPDVLVKELRAIPEYVTAFQKVFGGTAGRGRRHSITWPRPWRRSSGTLLSFNSKFDRYAAGDTGALDQHERERHEGLPLAQDPAASNATTFQPLRTIRSA